MITLTAEITINNETIVLDYSRITSIDISIFDRSDLSKPSYGIISNSGDMTFNDYDSKFLKFAHNGLLTADLPVRFFLNNTKNQKQKQIAAFETVLWDYDNDNKVASVSLTDGLEKCQNIWVKGLKYNPNDNVTVTMVDFYGELRSKAPSAYTLIPFNELDTKTKNILEKTHIDFFILKDGNLWEQYRKICEVCGLYIYKNGDGKIVCNYTYGS